MAINVSAELSVLQAVAQFLTYAVIAVFAENAVFFRALGVSRLNKLVNDPKISTWQYCIPIILVQTISAPMGWAAQSLTLPALAKVLPGWLSVNALRPLVFLNCSLIAMGIVWLLLGLFPKSRDACREQLPGATFNCCVLGTLLVAASQNYNLPPPAAQQRYPTYIPRPAQCADLYRHSLAGNLRAGWHCGLSRART